MQNAFISRFQSTRQTTLERLAGIPAADFSKAAPGATKTPAWIAGHLSVGDLFLLVALGGGDHPLTAHLQNEDLMAGFGPESDGRPVQDTIPSPEELTRMLAESTSAVAAQFEAVGTESFSQPSDGPDEIREFVPTRGDAAAYFLWHEGWHGAQLAAWMTASGIDPSPPA